MKNVTWDELAQSEPLLSIDELSVSLIELDNDELENVNGAILPVVGVGIAIGIGVAIGWGAAYYNFGRKR